MVAPGERRDCERLGMIPPLGACGQHERPPMRGNGRVKKRNGESRNRDRRENSLVHFKRKCRKSLNAPLLRNKDYRAGGI